MLPCAAGLSTARGLLRLSLSFFSSSRRTCVTVCHRPLVVARWDSTFQELQFTFAARFRSPGRRGLRGAVARAGGEVEFRSRAIVSFALAQAARALLPRAVPWLALVVFVFGMSSVPQSLASIQQAIGELSTLSSDSVHFLDVRLCGVETKLDLILEQLCGSSEPTADAPSCSFGAHVAAGALLFTFGVRGVA